MAAPAFEPCLEANDNHCRINRDHERLRVVRYGTAPSGVATTVPSGQKTRAQTGSAAVIEVGFSSAFLMGRVGCPLAAVGAADTRQEQAQAEGVVR